MGVSVVAHRHSIKTGRTETLLLNKLGASGLCSATGTPESSSASLPPALAQYYPLTRSPFTLSTRLGSWHACHSVLRSSTLSQPLFMPSGLLNLMNT